MIRVVIVEDSFEAREGFKYLLGLDKDIRVLRAYDHAEAFLEDEDILKLTDIVLMDIELPGMNGIQATRMIKELNPMTDILILTIFEEQDKIITAIQAGAVGYILKNVDPTELVNKVKSIKQGGSPIDPMVARKLLEEFYNKKERTKAPAYYHLTKREIEVCKSIINGYTYKEIADQLQMANATAKKHILHIYQKLQVNSKVEFVRKALDEKLLEDL